VPKIVSKHHQVSLIKIKFECHCFNYLQSLMFPTSPSGTLGSGPIRRHMGPAPQCPALLAPRHTRHEGDMKETQGGIQETKKTGRQSKSLGHENMVRPASEPSVNAPGCLTKDEDLYIERDFGQPASWWHSPSVQNSLIRSVLALFRDIKMKDKQGQTADVA